MRPRRPRSWKERLVGWMLVGLGAATMFILTLSGYTDVSLFPGTHDVLYFMAGILAAAGGTWWLGLFDGDDRGRRPGV